MDNFHWNDIRDNLKQKRIIIAAGVIVFLIIIIIVSLTLQMSPAPSPDPVIATPTSIINQISGNPGTPQLSGIPNNLPKWNLYTGAGYSFEYPPDWVTKKNNIEGGGEIVIVKPNILPDGVNYPEFILEKEPFTEGRIEQRIGINKALGLVESATTLLNQPAKKVSGTVPFKKYGSETLNEPVQQTMIFVTYANNNYAFIYEYEGSVVNKDLERYFNDIISGIRFK